MKALPPVSFFVPAYNCEATLEQTISSIFDGNFQPSDEIVIVNDASSDGTSRVIQSLREKYPVIQAIDHKFNKGGGAARNTAVENASHDVLFCVDSDNVLAPRSTGRLLEFLVNQSCDVAAFQYVYYFQTSISEITHKWRFNPGQTRLADHLAGVIVPGASGNYMFTRKSWLKAGGYPEFAGALDAWGFALQQLATNQKMLVLPDSHYLHRYGHDSYWVRESRKGRTSLTALQLVIPFLADLKKSDVDYIMGRGRYDWFEKMADGRPLHLISGRVGRAGTVEEDRRLPELSSGFIKRFISAFSQVFR